MREEVIKSVLSNISADFMRCFETGLEEHQDQFPYTLALIKSVIELRKNNKEVNLNKLIDPIRIELNKEWNEHFSDKSLKF